MTAPDITQTNALPTGTWQLDPAQTAVTVTATKLGLFKIPANLEVTAGTITIDADHRVSEVEIVVDAGSYASANDKRNEHILSADFLDVENHPELTFRASQVSSAGTGYRADGVVTVKGQRSPIAVEIGEVHLDGDRGTFVATATLDRYALGVDKMPSLIIGRSLELSVSATAQLQSR